MMNEVYFDSVGVRLGRRLDLREAVADGRYPDAEYVGNALLAVCVSDDEFAPDLAVAAARQALDRRQPSAADVRLLLHHGTYFQGQDVWTPSSYVQQQTIGGSAPAMEIDQKSNGGLAGLLIGASFLSACPDDATVLMTTGERFCLPGFDRFRTESGTVMADGGTALLLSSRPGFARVLSCVLNADPSLEAMYRGTRLKDAPHAGDKPLDLRGRKARFMRKNLDDLEDISQRIASGFCDTIGQALDEAKVAAADVRRFVLPNNGRTVRWWTMLAEMGVPDDRTTWEFGRRVGHLGAGDQVAGLEHLLTTGCLAVGDHVVLAGSGYGFNWGAAVLEIVTIPDWARP
ncbi:MULTISPECIES: ketoacyl-ACP synthase III family protein [unclassified Micromonospora]|uniref:ketoacyl-ACP synthase III family protein n=1 Tax=unclassified Micromonospora TaxID=2617518 RepID=UPI001C5E18CD|nr:ketoacyl-ACP synthase III family protein [Micromonospora sp. RL09-050-HVF-A]MBW4704214.1 ketoacyl-ACP synthase III family protein [Micromonospora sp. RL09-050-HVF-A]